jgi:multiple sugar transport system substrate-binding protein
MRRILFVLVALLALASVVVACTPAAPAPAAPAPAAEEAAATEAPAEEAAAEEAVAEEATPEPAAEEATPELSPADATATASAPLVVAAEEVEGKANVRWYVGLGTGTDPLQIEAQQAVVDAFNASHPDINLILEVVPYAAARDTLLTQIAAGEAPDIVGPVGHAGSNYLKGMFLDLQPLADAAGYDLNQFDQALIDFYQTDEGLVGLPFAVFPGATYFQRSHFDEAGLNYPPSEYGDAYVWPDGTEEEWNYDTLKKVAQILTVDVNGNAPVTYDDSGNVEPNPDFDATQIVQYGFVPQYMAPYAFAAYYAGASIDYNPEDNSAAIPEGWVEAWKWWYDGIFGETPFIPSDPVVAAPEFGSGNPFNSGRVSMGITQQWYTCCLADAGDSWDMATLPASTIDGEIHGRLDADTFRALNSTDEPEATFTVLDYLTGEASLDLLPNYGGLPARAEDQDSFYALKAEQFPFVENWETIRAGMAYPDTPSAEGYRPNFPEVFEAYNTFGTVLRTGGIDIDAEIQAFSDTLTTIMQRPTE